MQNKNYKAIENLVDKYQPNFEQALERLPESPLKEALLGDFYEYVNTLMDDLRKADKMEIQFKELKNPPKKKKNKTCRSLPM